MAKALLGHIGGSHIGGNELRMAAEVRRLQQRVRDLESQVLRLQAANDALAAAVHHDELIILDGESVKAGESVRVKEPALAGSTA